jgi:hypothetical protein
MLVNLNHAHAEMCGLVCLKYIELIGISEQLPLKHQTPPKLISGAELH